MRSLALPHSSSWLSRNQADLSPSLDSHHSLAQLPPSPTFISPRAAPKAPTAAKNSSLKGFQAVFNRKPPRSPSLHSDPSRLIPDNHTHHPYAPMPPPPLPVVSNHDTLDDEQECPVCLEPLSFSFRLPGEKPHVVPECGHSLHEVSTQIYSISRPHIPRSLGMFYRCLWPAPWPVKVHRPSQVQLGRVRCLPPSHENRRWRQ